jgi:excisionase family DNA binding protein
MMGFNLFMSRQQVVEKYGIAPELEQEVFAVLKPVGSSGASAQYLESMVDEQLDKYFANKDRLQVREAWSYPNKEAANMSVASDRVRESVGPLLKLKQAAQYLAIGERTLQYEVAENNISCVRMGNHCIRFTQKDLDEYVDRHRSNSQAAGGI